MKQNRASLIIRNIESLLNQLKLEISEDDTSKKINYTKDLDYDEIFDDEDEDSI
jgi:hypothetical protein